LVELFAFVHFDFKVVVVICDYIAEIEQVLFASHLRLLPILKGLFGVVFFVLVLDEVEFLENVFIVADDLDDVEVDYLEVAAVPELEQTAEAEQPTALLYPPEPAHVERERLLPHHGSLEVAPDLAQLPKVDRLQELLVALVAVHRLQQVVQFVQLLLLGLGIKKYQFLRGIYFGEHRVELRLFQGSRNVDALVEIELLVLFSVVVDDGLGIHIIDIQVVLSPEVHAEHQFGDHVLLIVHFELHILESMGRLVGKEQLQIRQKLQNLWFELH